MPRGGTSLLLLVAALLICVHVAESRSLTGLARCDSLHAAGRYAESAMAAEALLQQVEADEGSMSPAAAVVIDRIVRAMIAGRQTGNPACRELAERALAIRREAYGEEHPDVAASLVNLGVILEHAGDYAAARELDAQALAIRESTLPPDDPAIAESLIVVANLSARMGEYEGLADLYVRALAILESAHGPDDVKVAGACLNHAIYCKLTGDFDQARRLYDRALAIYEIRLGPDHPRVARLLHNQGNLLVLAGELADARVAYLRALAIREQALGPEHRLTALTVEALALLERQAGNLLVALDHARRAAAIQAADPNTPPPRVIQAQCVVASIEFYLGDTRRAEERALAALATQIDLMGENHPRTAEILDLLGHTRSVAGDLEGAAAYQRRSLTIRETVLPAGHPNIAQSARLLATTLIDAGDLDEAYRLLSRSLAMDTAALGPRSTELVADLQRLGQVTWLRGDVAEAQRLLERCVALSADVVGPRHPRHAVRMQQLSLVLADAGDAGAALDLALAVESSSRKQLRTVVLGLPEAQALRYAAVRTSGLDVALSLLADGEVAASGANAVWDEIVRSRAVILDEMARRQRRLSDHDDPEVDRLQQDLAAVTGELAWLVVSTGDERDDDPRRRERYAAALQRQEDLGRELARRSGDYRRRRDQLAVGLAEVTAAVPDDHALVAYVRYDRRRSASTPPDADRSRYVALVWTDAAREVACVPLGAAADIDLLVSRWRDEVVHGTRVPGRPAADAERACRDAGARLRGAVWDPVASQLGDVDGVFVVPDGSLDLMDFAALPAADGRYLAETGPLLHLVTAERDLAAPAPSRSAAGGLLAVGAPDFDAGHGATGAATAVTQQATSRGGLAPSARREFRDLIFTPLPATATEIAEIADLWERSATVGGEWGPVLRLTGSAASEEAFKRLAGDYRSLHVATHGFFLGDERGMGATGTRGVGGLRPAAVTPDAGPPAHPLLVSGLALAGANTRETADPGEEDGIVMAAEIATLDLAGVRCAVLSACESGLGDLQAGEGVIGLRRAFQVAGATTVIMSLWAVDDAMARHWMGELYRARLTGGLATAAAVREAGLQLLAARRADGLSTHPYHWAGFIAAGDWR